MFKLQKSGINGKLMNLMEDYLSSQKQRIALNGKYLLGKTF